jgi:hypothetical protein
MRIAGVAPEWVGGGRAAVFVPVGVVMTRAVDGVAGRYTISKTGGSWALL